MEAVTTFFQPFFDWLGETTLIAAVVVCLILAAQKTLGGRLGPRWCHALWLVLLLRMVLPWVPSSRFSLSSLIHSRDRRIQTQQSPDTIERQKPSAPAEAAESSEAPPEMKSQPEIAVPEVVSPKPQKFAGVEGEFGNRFVSIRRLLPILWLAGAIVVGAYILASDFALWRIVKRDRPLMKQPMLELFEECKVQMGVQSLVVVVPSSHVKSPGLFGFVRPRLLLPQEMLDSATPEEMRYVFLHELAHLKRHDIYLGWLASLLQVLHWFNPLVWFAFSRMRADRELACDALVLTRAGQDKSHEYGGAILGLVRRFSRSRPLPAMAGVIENKSQLKRRIAMITQFDNKSYRWSPLATALIVILACISLPDGTRTKASGASVSGPPMTIRQVWKDPQLSSCGPISPCGRYIAFRDKETGELAIRELTTGTNRRLTTTEQLKQGGRGYVMSDPVFSPDSSRIAYAWVEKDEGPDLRVIGLDTSAPRILIEERGTSALPIAWSPDGNALLVNLYKFKSPMDSHYALVDVSDGSLRILESLAWDMNVGVTGFSPNGKYILYDSPQEKDSTNSDVFLLALDTGAYSRLVEHPANDKALGWTPDGSAVLFTSDRRGTRDAWLIHVTEDKPHGEPRLVKPDLGSARGLGFTQNGSFYYSFWSQPSDVYVATLDSETSRVVEPPKKVSLYREGSSSMPDWSTDGRYLAYVSHEWERRPKIIVMTVQTGECRELSTSLDRIVLAGARWSPDGRSFILAGSKGTNESIGIYRVDVQTGEENLVVKNATRPIVPEWTPNGKGIVYQQGGGPAGPWRIMLHDIETGQERELASIDAWEREAGAFALSPDGRQLALTVREEEPRCLVLKLLPMAGGQPRELTRVMPPDTIGALEWMPDGCHLLFKKLRDRKNNNPTSGSTTLWCVSVEGGAEPQQVDLKDLPGTGLGYPRMHPDGRRIALTLHSPNTGELWVMENFLPTTAVAESGK